MAGQTTPARSSMTTTPARGIVDHLARRDGALLVMAADKRPLRTRVLGNIGEEVLRTSSRPVLLVGPAVATDGINDNLSIDVAADPRESKPREAERNPAEVEHLDPEACWQLLRSIRVGRLAVCADGRPLIFPVNYVVDGKLDRVPHGGRHEALRGA